MRKIRIKFADFYAGHDEQENFFVRLLRQRYDVEVHPKAEYMIFSRFGYDFLRHDGIRIFFTTENLRPNFDLADYALAFDHLSFQDRYLRLPLYRWYEEAYRAVLHTPKVAPSDATRKFCSYVVSNRRTSRSDMARAVFFHKLSEYRQVDAGGSQFNNVGGPVENKHAFISGYKFNIAFENTSSPGYTTEKLVEAKAAGTIPIYWGDPMVTADFNPRAFINCHDFADFDAVVGRVSELDNDPAAYLAMLAEPMFPNGEEPVSLRNEALLDFFSNIFEQPLEKAYRRVRVGRWGRRTEREYRRVALFDVKYQWERFRRRFWGPERRRAGRAVGGGGAIELDKTKG